MLGCVSYLLWLFLVASLITMVNDIIFITFVSNILDINSQIVIEIVNYHEILHKELTSHTCTQLMLNNFIYLKKIGNWHIQRFNQTYTHFSEKKKHHFFPIKLSLVDSIQYVIFLFKCWHKWYIAQKVTE